MPVGAGSIKRAATAAAVKPEAEKTQDVKPKVEQTKAEPVAKRPRKEVTAASKTKAGTKKDAKQDVKQQNNDSADQTQTKGPDRLGNQIYHITDELPVHLL